MSSYDYEREFEFSVGNRTIFFTENSQIEFWDEDDMIMRMDPVDLKICSVVYDAMMKMWAEYDKEDAE